MNFEIIPAPLFEKELKYLAKKYPSIKKDLSELIEILLKEPRTGIALGNNCYKIRLAISSKAKGKSGGARVITHIQIVKKNIFLLSIYDKSEAENISESEILLRIRNLI